MNNNTNTETTVILHNVVHFDADEVRGGGTATVDLVHLDSGEYEVREMVRFDSGNFYKEQPASFANYDEAMSHYEWKANR